MNSAIWWIRRDLRLHDNPALHAALAHGAVIPLFILDPAILNARWHRAAIRRREFLLAGLRSLDRALRSMGSRLIVRSGEPVIVLGSLVAESGATAIYAVEDFSPYARRRDAAVQTVLPLTLTDGVTVHHPAWIQRKQGGPYTVFTPFYRAWRAWPMPRNEEILVMRQMIQYLVANTGGSWLRMADEFHYFVFQ